MCPWTIHGEYSNQQTINDVASISTEINLYPMLMDTEAEQKIDSLEPELRISKRVSRLPNCLALQFTFLLFTVIIRTFDEILQMNA